MKSIHLGLITEGIVFVAVALTPLLILMTILFDEDRSIRVGVLSVDGLCCNHMASIAENELGRVSGVKRCVANRETQTLRVILKQANEQTLKAVWDTAERESLQPRKLTLAPGRL